MKLSSRQKKIVKIVKAEGPIAGENIAGKLDLSRATLRPDLAFLTQLGILGARPRVGYYYSGKNPFQGLVERVMSMRVRDFFSVPVVVSENISIYDAIVNMFVNDVGTLFVVSENQILEGVVSRKDLLKITLGKANLNQMPLGVVMTRMPNIVTTTPEESLWNAARKLTSHEVDALPVVTSEIVDNQEVIKVIGRLSKTNITKAYVDLGLGKLGKGES